MTRRLALVLLLAALAAAAPGAQAGRREQLLVSPAWLSGHLKDANLVLIHVGMGDAATYAAGHIPGAQYAPTEEFAATMDRAEMAPGDLMLEMPPVPRLRATLEKHGITPASRIVLYFGRNEIPETTRVRLALEYAGLGANTSILQGGLAAWTRAGYATTAEVRPVKASAFGAITTRAVTVDAAFVRAHTGQPGTVLIDGRNQAAYDGLEGNGGPAGRIPGARSLHYRLLYDERSELRPPAELEALFAKAGVKRGDRIVGYCWIGSFATATLFAAKTLGYDVVLYDGSLEDWNRRGLPLEPARKSERSR